MIGRETYFVKLSIAGICALCFSVLISGCHPGENSERIAKKENDKNFTTRSSEKEADFVVEMITSD